MIDEEYEKYGTILKQFTHLNDIEIYDFEVSGKPYTRSKIEIR